MNTPRPTERTVQETTVQLLRAAGFHVLETSAWRQKGPSGVDKGVPDLLVSHALRPYVFVGIEMKRDSKAPVSPEQKEHRDACRYVVCWDPVSALDHAVSWLLNEASATDCKRALSVLDQLKKK